MRDTDEPGAAWRRIELADTEGWSVRVINALLPHFHTLGNLADATENEIRRLPNIGMIALTEIRMMLALAQSGRAITRRAGPTIGETAAAARDALCGPSCETCRWWLRGQRPMLHGGKPSSDLGECRRNAPQAMPKREPSETGANEDTRLVAWPETAARDWCGEYRTASDPRWWAAR